jgi:hypothetical protein
MNKICEIIVKKFEPESLDFIFLDAYLSYEDVKRDLNSWFKVIKKGGLFSGHDWDCPAIQRAVNEFRFENGIKSRMLTYGGYGHGSKNKFQVWYILDGTNTCK